MKDSSEYGNSVRQVLNVEEAIRGVGLELLMLAEEYIYASKPLDNEEVARLGSDLYLLSKVLGTVLRDNGLKLTRFSIRLPEDVGAVIIRNPYFDPRSESPDDKAAGQSDSIVGDLPF